MPTDPRPPVPGVLHHYDHRRFAFEYGGGPTDKQTNTLIWIGGLGDGVLTVGYVDQLAQTLPAGWSLAQVVLSSAFNGWGTSSLARDAKELGRCVAYFRQRRTGLIALMGHSTGCQDVMEYLTGGGHAERAPVDGAILQAPVSDRESLVHSLPASTYEHNNEVARRFVAEGRADEVLPSSATAPFKSPVTAYRWLSLASPDGEGDDDYFSSDAPQEKVDRIFGSIGRAPLLILFSGNDEAMPQTIDKAALFERWSKAVVKGGGAVDEVNGGIVANASHSLDGSAPEVVNDLVARVNRFLEKTAGGDFKSQSKF